MPGAKPTQPRLPGVGLEKLFALRAVEDTFRIKGYIRQNHPKSAVLMGGGVQARHFVTGQNTLLSLAGPAPTNRGLCAALFLGQGSGKHGGIRL